MIDVRIPYGIGGTLAEAYNEAMQSSKQDWVLLLDHDVFLALNPYWYEMCCAAVKAHPSAGAFTCVTYGRNGFDEDQTPTDDINTHQQIAHDIYNKYGNINESVNAYQLPGFFMLVNKSVWKSIGGFKTQGKGVNKIDHDFFRRVLEGNYHIYIMKGLYVYHKKGVRKLKWNL